MHIYNIFIEIVFIFKIIIRQNIVILWYVLKAIF